MANSIAFAKNYTSIIDEVYQRASVSSVLNSPSRMVRAGHNAREVTEGMGLALLVESISSIGGRFVWRRAAYSRHLFF